MTPCADFFFRRGPPSEPRKGGVSPGGVTHTRGQSLTPAGRTDDSMTSVVRKCSEVELDIIVLWKVIYCSVNVCEHLFKPFHRLWYCINTLRPLLGIYYIKILYLYYSEPPFALRTASI